MLKFFSYIFVLTGSHFSFHCLKMKRIRVFSRSGLNNNVMVILGYERDSLLFCKSKSILTLQQLIYITPLVTFHPMYIFYFFI